ncbi:phosphoglycolate phosphatase [Natronobacterium gregoryi]|uniref:Phosphoglycolate phosphatase n=2 Tax=Natronobacterium gregoryi TaxID=44930 RepID=L0AJ02_NATGS|nr:phosphoglycolate phosphatase [Natronobacterium gregoryi]AFZ73429.1 sucrose-phosphate phosphatase-like hydrolase, Archaeal [Natronobacterium gregoryi SP2]ELY68625.1 phosphoglycolate phosphatase [Natronobacterium gregoryi SP2]PLK20462.1 phosphoglycolate phosphatase [Natronobacterium gregoryi SP2]SFI72086.1 phosphoglycolate phosphatase [Natronobacterium gregoryi]
MTVTPPLVLDVDGTLTRPEGKGIDPRLFDPLREWDAPVVVATGKAFPYPVALCHFVGLSELVVAENGGVVYTGDDVFFTADRAAAQAVVEEYRDAGYDLGWGTEDTVNRWRETEIAVALESPVEPLREIAASRGLEVVDTGYAYHVKDANPNKGTGVERIADHVGFDPETAVAVGDSVNDVSTFELVGRSFAVANADESARVAADEVLEESHADGTLSVLERVRGDTG